MDAIHSKSNMDGKFWESGQVADLRGKQEERMWEIILPRKTRNSLLNS